MKKLIAFFMSILLVLSLSACGSQNAPTQSSESQIKNEESISSEIDDSEAADTTDTSPDSESDGTSEPETTQDTNGSDNIPDNNNGSNSDKTPVETNPPVTNPPIKEEPTPDPKPSNPVNPPVMNPPVKEEPTPDSELPDPVLPPVVQPPAPNPEPEPDPEPPVPQPPIPDPNPEPDPEPPVPTPTQGKTLIVYFSWSSNTERMANTIREQTGGDLIELIPVTAYPTDYTACTEVALAERDNNARPAIQNLPSSIDEYDTILVGYPIWWHTAPMIIGTFLESYDLTGIDVYPFTQSASMDRTQFNNSMEFVRECAEGATVHDGLFARYSDENAIITYLTENNLIPNKTDATGGKTLVAYYSASGNTENVAEYIAKATDADLFELVPTSPYTSADLNWTNPNSRVVYEHDNPDARTVALTKSTVSNWDQYDTVFIGYPIWWGIAAWPVDGFIKANDFTGKTVIPFCTSSSSGLGDSGKLLEEMAGNGHWIEGQRFSSRASEQSVREWVDSLNLDHSEQIERNTVLHAVADPQNSQTLYLWEENNMPAVTEYTQNNGNYADDPDFRPYLVTFPVPDGTQIKGAVLICAGGAFQFRSDQMEGTPVAQELSRLGYQSFVVNYRLRPYIQEEGALDLARAVRFVRKNAAVYGIDEKDIAVMGFSAGGILAGEMLLNYDGTINGKALDQNYVPDALDSISADAGAAGMIYSFYGRLSVSNNNVQTLRNGDLPPTFYCYGTRDPFYNQFLANANAAEAAGVQVERMELNNRPHGFGYREGWIPTYDMWLSDIFDNN